MFGIHGAAADVDGRAVDLFDSKQIEREADADDVADGIDCADFVKMDLLDVDAVNCRFRFSKGAEYALGVCFHSLGDVDRVDHLKDAAEVPVSGRFGGHDKKFHRADAAALHTVPSNSRAEGQRVQSARDRVAVRSGIGEGADQHVSGESGERIDIADGQGDFSLGDRWIVGPNSPERAQYQKTQSSVHCGDALRRERIRGGASHGIMLLGNWITRFTESLANGPVRVEIYPPVMSVVAEWTHGKKRAGQIEAAGDYKIPDFERPQKDQKNSRREFGEHPLQVMPIATPTAANKAAKVVVSTPKNPRIRITRITLRVAVRVDLT
jgi:hypothetical protein